MEKSNKESKNPPVVKRKLRGITVDVFENTSDKGIPFYKTNITRSYWDGNAFQKTSTFGRDDLPIVELLSRYAWLEILKREEEQQSQKKGDSK